MGTSYWRDKVVLVTGGTAGLGRALVETAAAAGAQVALAARDAARLAETEAALARQGCRALTVAADITRDEDVARLVDAVRERFGRLDALVNNAGRSSRGAVLDTTPEEFQRLWELNFLGAVRCTRAAAPLLLEARGHLVNIGSLAAKSAAAYLGAYPASKFPLAAYSQQLRLELGPQGLHVLLVCPGPIARADAGHRYDAQTGGLPEAARRPGGGVKLQGLDPQRLAHRIWRACRRRHGELVVPGKARLLFSVAQLSPSLGDWILRHMT